MTKRCRTTGAFTLIELLTVIVIVGIIAAMTVPALRRIQSTALQTASRQVSNSIQLTRQYAITHRTQTRFVVAVDTSSGNIRPELICRAYTICAAVGDADGALLYWLPLQDWSYLPGGIVFSDLNAKSYSPLTLSQNLPPPLGQSTRSLTDIGSGSLTFNNADNSFLVTNMVGAGTVQWKVSYLEFRPTGMANWPGVFASCAVRLMQGSVLDPTTRQLLINDTNNWAYVETDRYGGRVRVRYRDDYK
jgi:prepilin-type N-terminal cleavage/methylation domain-containing protein